LLPECWNHDPELSDSLGNTVAMLFIAKDNILYLPECWMHEPGL
jgi:hypothetical protein